MAVRHFLQFSDFSREEYEYVFERTRWIKDMFKRYVPYQPLRDRTLAMVFEKQSTRTRVSFEAGMHQLGGAVITIMTRDTQMDRGEPIEDVARVITRMVDIVMIRTFEQALIERFAAHSTVPVVNGLTNEHHPCQILGDLYTYLEHRGSIRGKGLMIGIELEYTCGELVQQALERGVLINVTMDNVIRLLPPLVFRREEAELLLATLVPLIADFLDRQSAPQAAAQPA